MFLRLLFWAFFASIVAIATSNVLFDTMGGHWGIVPLIWLSGFATHAITFHLF